MLEHCLDGGSNEVRNCGYADETDVSDVGEMTLSGSTSCCTVCKSFLERSGQSKVEISYRICFTKLRNVIISSPVLCSRAHR